MVFVNPGQGAGTMSTGVRCASPDSYDGTAETGVERLANYLAGPLRCRAQGVVFSD